MPHATTSLLRNPSISFFLLLTSVFLAGTTQLSHADSTTPVSPPLASNRVMVLYTEKVKNNTPPPFTEITDISNTLIDSSDLANRAQISTRIAWQEKIMAQHDLFDMRVSTLSNGIDLIELPSRYSKNFPSDLDALITDIERQPGVFGTILDYQTKAFMVSNDEYQNLQWHFHDPIGGINLQKAWDIALHGSFNRTLTPVNVAVIDSGILPHADLTGHVVDGIDFISNPAIARDGNGRDLDPTDPGDFLNPNFCSPGVPSTDTPSTWHGTVVSGIIGASINNGIGVTGIAPNARIVPIRVIGPCGGSMLDALEGLLWAAGEPLNGIPSNANTVRIANLSLGVSGLSCTPEIQNLINTAVRRGVTVVVATGNENANADQVVPTSCDNVIAVAASSASGRVTNYSNLGESVDLMAPGGSPQNPADPDDGILSTSNNGQQGAGEEDYIIGYAGTSVAAPHVTGVIALMLGLDPTLTPRTIEEHLIASASKPTKRCQGCGAGILNAAGAVNRVAGSSNKTLLYFLLGIALFRRTAIHKHQTPNKKYLPDWL